MPRGPRKSNLLLSAANLPRGQGRRGLIAAADVPSIACERLAARPSRAAQFVTVAVARRLPTLSSLDQLRAQER